MKLNKGTMKYKKHFPKFIKELDQKLKRGFEEYGDESFDLPPEKLLKELREEALDICGWGFILWVVLKEYEKRNKTN